MSLFLLILLLLAAAAGVLGAVLKITLVIVLSLVFAVVLLGYLGAWYVRRRVRGLQRDVERRMDEARRRRSAYDVRSSGDETRGLGDGS